MNGESSLREVALRSGEVRRKKVLDAQHFAEGVTRLNGRCRRGPPPRPPPHRLVATSAGSRLDRVAGAPTHERQGMQGLALFWPCLCPLRWPERAAAMTLTERVYLHYSTEAVGQHFNAPVAAAAVQVVSAHVAIQRHAQHPAF